MNMPLLASGAQFDLVAIIAIIIVTFIWRYVTIRRDKERRLLRDSCSRAETAAQWASLDTDRPE